jgi:hypothetical protein
MSDARNLSRFKLLAGPTQVFVVDARMHLSGFLGTVFRAAAFIITAHQTHPFPMPSLLPTAFRIRLVTIQRGALPLTLIEFDKGSEPIRVAGS